jgi:hypothetical protein
MDRWADQRSDHVLHPLDEEGDGDKGLVADEPVERVASAEQHVRTMEAARLDALLFVNEGSRDGRDDLSGQVVSLVDIDRRHESHQAGNPRVNKRVFERAAKGRDENLAFRVRPKVLGHAADEDASVGPDRRLWVELRLGEQTEEIIVHEPLRELRRALQGIVARDQRHLYNVRGPATLAAHLRRDERHGLDGGFADDGDGVVEAGDLRGHYSA